MTHAAPPHRGLDRGKAVIAGLAVLVAVWLGLTAPNVSPVAPPAPPAGAAPAAGQG